MLSKKELHDILDSVHQLEEIENVHPCLGCDSLQGDPEECRGCADVDLCPSLQPMVSRDEPRYRDLFKILIG
ncbi:unnamed protein product [marine sediment metagenome]|uniref:Uncharacterized protein n=1 Tax=marine sediment metagenome TaxID=412755 RepID=X1AKI9_9ZZZZ